MSMGTTNVSFIRFPDFQLGNLTAQCCCKLQLYCDFINIPLISEEYTELINPLKLKLIFTLFKYLDITWSKHDL